MNILLVSELIALARNRRSDRDVANSRYKPRDATGGRNTPQCLRTAHPGTKDKLFAILSPSGRTTEIPGSEPPGLAARNRQNKKVSHGAAQEASYESQVRTVRGVSGHAINSWF